MSLRFASLGSGSRGNATLIQTGDALVMLDCGYPAAEIGRRCEALGVAAAAIDAILVTHEHGDHIRGVLPMTRRHGTPVWATHGTSLALDWEAQGLAVHLCHGHDAAFRIGDLEIVPFVVPHDAREPVQYLFRCRDLTLGVLTDTGSVTPVIRQHLDGVDALILEFNHDPEMLASGPYPPSLQRRVRGDYGHLSNAQSAALLDSIDCARLRTLAAAHVSEKNNAPAHVHAALQQQAPALAPRLSLLVQDRPSDWFEL